MASITSRAHVVEVEPQVRPLGNRNLVVCVKVALTAVKAVPKSGQHSIRWRLTEAGLSKHFDDIRLPVAVSASPTVALEAKDAQPKVISIVSALGGRAASYVVFTLSLPAVFFARSAVCESGAAGHRARTSYCVRHLLGVIPLTYVLKAGGNIAAAVGPVCTELRKIVRDLGVR